MNDPEAPILLFPTHYLGNFILGMPWVVSVLRKHPRALVVLDAQFEALARLVLDDNANLLLYPRKQISRGQKLFSRLSWYWRFLRALRQHRSQTLLDLEGERFSGVLARLSGCSRRVGPAAKRAKIFYTDIIDNDYRQHRFKVFGDILEGFTDGSFPSSAFDFAIDNGSYEVVSELLQNHDHKRPLVAIHPGASVSYKLWPRPHFAALARELTRRGCRIVWVGAGNSDSAIISDIISQLAVIETINLCNQLSYVLLTALYTRCKIFIGSDSGPMHLAASTGLPVFALFGPSNETVWAPLGDNAHLVRSSQPCGKTCKVYHCQYEYRCMQTLKPADVIAEVEDNVPGLTDSAFAAEKDSRQPVPNLYRTLPVSAYVITLNEAANIGACLDRLVEFDEVILVDSGSGDGTVEIASQYSNVKSSFNAWQGFSNQKTHALSLCSNEWVINVDADEILTDELIDEIRRVVTENKVDALECSRVLRRWGIEPRSFEKSDRLVRLFRKSTGSYPVRRVHEYISINGEVGKTEAAIEHHENLTYSQRIEKANCYSQARAEDKLENGARSSVMILIFVFPVSFIQSYLLKGNFLDGVDGLLSSMNTAYYKFMKYAKLWELKKGRTLR